MDAESRRRRRESSVSLRENRWSMSSQRLEQIVAELMKPVSDVRTSFDRNLTGLLEEYLTEAGLRALAAEEEAERAGTEPPPVNFPELGLILAQSTENWGKKVDLLYSSVLRFETELRASARRSDQDEEPADSPTSGGASRRRRRTASPEPALDFAPIVLEPHGATRRDAATAPPPTLPRMYIELEPRAAVQDERALRDYSHEVIGTLHDYSVSWRLLDGLLVEELETRAGTGAAPLRPLSLVELQRACERAAPALPSSPPRTPPPPSPSPPPTAASTPLPARMPPPAALRRKRRSTVHVEDLLAGSVKICMSSELRARLSTLEEYSVPASWVRRVVAHRKHAILAARRSMTPFPAEFCGFDSPWTDIGGFPGFPPAEGAAARAEALARRRLQDKDAPESDDDGFFERSSSLEASDGLEAADMDLWKAQTLRRLEESLPLDLAALRRGVARALPLPPAALPWRDLLAATATAQRQQSVSRIFLSVLMQANKGEVEIVSGAPLALGDFAVRAACASSARPPDSADDEWPQEP